MDMEVVVATLERITGTCLLMPLGFMLHFSSRTPRLNCSKTQQASSSVLRQHLQRLWFPRDITAIEPPSSLVLLGEEVLDSVPYGCIYLRKLLAALVGIVPLTQDKGEDIVLSIYQ